MKFLKYLLFIPASLFVVSCIAPIPQTRGPVVNPPTVGVGTLRPDDYYEKRKERDKDRVAVLERARDRNRGKQCEGDDDCEDICKDIYDRRADREDCEDDLTVAQVERLEDLYELLEDADLDDLEDVDLDDLDVLVNISIEPLDDLVNKYSSRESKEFLTWVAKNSDVAALLEKEDDEYQILKELLGNVATSNVAAFKSNIDGGETFFDIIVEEGNEEAFEWVQQFIEDEECSGDAETTSCFTKYCEIGRSMDNDYLGDLLDFEDFEDYIDDIIDAKINGVSGGAGSKWDTDNIEDSGDLNDDWEDELCGGL